MLDVQGCCPAGSVRWEDGDVGQDHAPTFADLPEMADWARFYRLSNGLTESVFRLDSKEVIAYLPCCMLAEGTGSNAEE
jgi:hypothetical protein